MASRPTLKTDDDVGFVKFYRGLQAKDEFVKQQSRVECDEDGDINIDRNVEDCNSSDTSRTVRLFDRGEYFSAHGADAELVSRHVYRTTAGITRIGRDSVGYLESITISMTNYRLFVRDALLRLGLCIELWSASGNGEVWKLARWASPGNVQAFEDELGNTGSIESPFIMSIKVSGRVSEMCKIGLCFTDTSSGNRELGISEFMDNEVFSDLEAMIIQLSIKECLLAVDASGRNIELAKVCKVIENCNAVVTRLPAIEFRTRDIEDDLTRLLSESQVSSNDIKQLIQLEVAMGATAALVNYLNLTGNSDNFGQYRVYRHDLSKFMKLDSAAVRALNLMPTGFEGSKTMSLFGLLDQCKTAAGSRLLVQWLRQPLTELDEIERRQNLVQAVVNDTSLRQILQEDHLRAVPDISRLVRKFNRKSASLEDVVRIYQLTLRLPDFLNVLEDVHDPESRQLLDEVFTVKIREYSQHLGKLREMVETAIDLKALDRHEYRVKAEFDDGLRDIDEQIVYLRERMNEELCATATDLGVEIDRKLFLENHRVYGWSFRVTRAESGSLRGRKGYTECATLKNGIYFTTQKLQGYRQDFIELNDKYNRMQKGLVGEVITVASSYTGVLEKLAVVLANLDVIVGLGHVAVHAPIPYVRPRMHARGTGDTILKESRHPCMEVQDNVRFITNDVNLKRGESEFLIITGPNMGGKSTYIRQVGVIALMAQVGSFVPCSEAEVSVFDCILARVGAGDSQVKGLSTFMAEMLETANILKTATRESLIIIDELGRGTSTYDGFGLAWAISEYIVNKIGAMALFATHFHEMTALADMYPQIHNLHVVAHIPNSLSDTRDDKKGKPRHENINDTGVTLLYKVEPGKCDQSFGIHVAEMVHFPPKVINMAKARTKELEDLLVIDATAHPQKVGYDENTVEHASTQLKELVRKWKSDITSTCISGTLSDEEQVERLCRLIRSNSALLTNPFFQHILATM